MKYSELFESIISDIVSAHGTDIKPIGSISVDVFRVGDWTDKYSIFFGGSYEDAEKYQTLHPEHEVKKYRITAKNAIVAPNTWKLFGFIRGKEFDGYDFDKIAQKMKSGVEAGRKIDEMARKAIKSAGYDVVIYSNPRPPAKYELQVVNQKSVIINEIL